MPDNSATPPSASSPPYAWETDDVAPILQTDLQRGLTDAEAQRRLAEYGPNAIESGPQVRLWAIILHQFTSPLIYILLIAMVITLAIQHWADAIVIGGVVALNAIVGFIQEHRAENAMQALMRLVSPRANVLRDGNQQRVESGSLVPGDVVLLESGDLVPADLRLIRCVSLQIDESLLTGESMAVNKNSEPLRRAGSLALGDQRNMAFMGTHVATGRGVGVVAATGRNAQIGAIAHAITQTERAQTPLQGRMTQLGKWISVIVVALSAAVFGGGVALGLPVADMFLTAIAIAVAAIPEGLPIAMTVALAVGVSRMGKRNAIIRRLVAVETLGSCGVIVTDKTGTLTENQMTVREIWAGGQTYRVEGSGLELAGEIRQGNPGAPVNPREIPALYAVLRAGVLANEANLRQEEGGRLALQGDPTETSLLMAAGKVGLFKEKLAEEFPQVELIPFESARRFSASIHQANGEELVLVKGAPERVLSMCAKLLGPDGEVPLAPEEALEAARQMAGQGLRVLAFAQGHGAATAEAMRGENPQGLTLLGLQGMMDPPRAEVVSAIAACKRAGIRVVMATGDHAATAAAIARDIGLADDGQVKTGPELEGLSAEEFAETARRVSVFSRVSPAQKHRLVTTLREQGYIVAVTGDGVNDAPALKAAHIGVAMGRSGTDVAREASDVALTDDNFATIYAAVEEGRTAFSNIRKVTFFLVSGGAGQILTILVSLALRMPLPLLPTQILWMNMVTNGIQDVALAFEPGEKQQYTRPPRSPKEGILPRVMLERMALVGVVMAAGALALFQWELNNGATLAYAQVTALTTLVMFQVFHVGNSRSEELSIFQKNLLSNPLLFYGTLISLAIHLGAMYFPPTQLLIRLEPLSLETWLRICVVAVSVVAVVELHKLLRRPRS